MAKRGRRPSDEDFSVEKTPVKGHYLVRFRVDGKAFCAVVRFRVDGKAFCAVVRFRVDDKAFCAVIRYGVPHPEDAVLTLSPYQTFKKIFKIAYPTLPDGKPKKLPKLGMGTDDAVVRRLTRKVLKFVRLLDLNSPPN